MNKSAIILAISLALVLSSVDSAPQNVEQYRYQPYSYEYSVSDPEKQLFHDKTESSDDNGKVR
jgi:starvation-inducible outer membrane lipoprotein